MNTLTPPQEQVLALISAGSTVSEAARSTGIHRNTVHNWVRSAPLFRQALSQARDLKSLFWRDQAEQLAADAVATIRASMAGADLPPALRLKAAQYILNLAIAHPPQTPVPPVDPPNGPQSEPDTAPSEPPTLEIVHNSAQSPAASQPGRNDPCPCGSGKKFKRCCANAPAELPAPGPPDAAKARTAFWG